MKYFKYLFFLSLLFGFSCKSIKVTTDYDENVKFKTYKTFAFYKPGIDKATISDLDKKRILRAVENELVAKGFSKSENPDFLVSIFTKSSKKVNVSQQNFGFGWGWHPWMMNGFGNTINVSHYSEGTLFIDFIDTKKKELVWQGVGTGALRIQNREKKAIRIKEFVKEIIAQFPPEVNQK